MYKNYKHNKMTRRLPGKSQKRQIAHMFFNLFYFAATV